MLAILLCFGLIALIDLTPLIRKKDRKDIAAFCLIFALALVISILNQLGMPPPSTIISQDTLLRGLHLYYQ
jgi:hypothetical protein